MIDQRARGRAMSTLVAAVSELLTRHQLPFHAAQLSRLTADDLVAAANPARELPVHQFLSAATNAAADHVPPAIASAVRALVPGAAWTQTTSYLREPPSPGFLDSYAHTTLAGPVDGGSEAVPSSLAVGLLLLAPHTLYPPHHHPADEIYLPLAPAAWLDAPGEPLVVRPGGTPLHHASWQPHGMRTGQHPLLAIYLWSGDVTSPSRWV